MCIFTKIAPWIFYACPGIHVASLPRIPHNQLNAEQLSVSLMLYLHIFSLHFIFTDAAACSIMKGEYYLTDAKKYLSGLTLLDRFLFAEAVEDQDNRIYDTEVQNRNTGNLPRRSRYYQGYIDTTQLKPGTVDFNRLGDIIQILIAPFDLIGDGYYRYTFRMNCMENKERLLGDGAVRIFLNTRGKNPQDVSPELVQLLHFMEHTNDPPPPGGECEKVQKLRRKIENIKANEEVGIRFMHAWEERELDRIEARNAGLEAGRTELLTNLVQRKLAKGQSPEKIAEDLMEELETIQKIADSLMQTDLL